MGVAIVLGMIRMVFVWLILIRIMIAVPVAWFFGVRTAG
jgi:hypothetical protein